MKILFVCMQYIHSVRWINQLKDTGHDIFMFDCLDKPIHDDLRWTKYTEDWSQRKLPYIKGEYCLEKKFPLLFSKIEPFLKVTASQKLKELIQEIKPDLVHSLEMQSQTYPLLKIRKQLDFRWAYSSWGSDLYLFQDQKQHRKTMQGVMELLEYLFVDNVRDITLAKQLGFTNNLSGVHPGGGGYLLNDYQKIIEPLEQRNLILIKGYHHWAGRALSVLDAIESIVEVIRDFDIYIYSAHDVVVEKIIKMNAHYNLNIQYSTRTEQISHEELLQKFGKARIAIGNNISDGVPNTLLEAIICGAFPIQSNPGGASEDYITHGENGFLIEDPLNCEEIAGHIKAALTNNALLQSAFELNQKVAQKLAYSKIRQNVLNSYKIIENQL